jgi:hypothetical protein
MDEPIWMRPKRWRDFQHYHDGRPNKFVKNYLSLDDAASKFRRLSWADQGRLQALWRLACRLEKDGLIPYDVMYIRAYLCDRRCTLDVPMYNEWFHIGTQKELKRAANRENRSSKLRQNSSVEVRSKKLETPTPSLARKKELVLVSACPECFIGGGSHTVDCSKKVA